MKADNVFRFVVSRPPTSVVTDDPRLVRGPPSVKAKADEVSRQSNFKKDPQKARRALGETIIESSYYRANPAWQHVKKHRHELVMLKGESDHSDFVKAIETLLRKAYDRPRLTFAEWVTSDEASSLRDTIWMSYMAGVLAPEKRPEDREELTDWIMLLHLAEAAASSRERFDEVAELLQELRPVLPGELYATVEPPPVEQPSLVIDRTRELSLERERESLEIALAQLAEVGASKRARAVELEMYETQSIELDADTGPRLERRAGREHDAGQQVSRGGVREVPWQLNEMDLDEHIWLGETLARLGIEPTASIPEVRSSIESELARVHGELAGERTMTEIVGFGRTGSLVERWLPQVAEIVRETVVEVESDEVSGE